MKKVFERWQKALLVFVCCMLLRYPVKQIMMMLPIRGEAAAMVLTALQALLVWGLPSIIIRPRQLKMRGLVPAALLGFAIQPLTGYLTMILNGIMSYEIQQTVFLPQSLAEWLVALLCLCMIPALCEEAFFRGMLQQTLTERFGCRSALVTVSVMFAAAHLSLSALPALLIISLMLCLCRQWTDSLPACAVMHATFNAAALMQLDTSTCPLFLLCCVAVVLLGTINLWRKSL